MEEAVRQLRHKKKKKKKKGSTLITRKQEEKNPRKQFANKDKDDTVTFHPKIASVPSA